MKRRIPFKKTAQDSELDIAKKFLKSNQYLKNAPAISEAFLEYLSLQIKREIATEGDADFMRSLLVAEYKKVLSQRNLFKPNGGIEPNTWGDALFDWAEAYIDENGLDDDPDNYTYDWLGGVLHRNNLLHKMIMIPYRDPEQWLKVWARFLKQYRRLDQIPPKGKKPIKFATQSRTAGEVRFVKDNSNDASSWAWKQGPSERSMQPDYNYNPKRKKALAKVLRSTTASMGHAMSAYNAFTKIKSADVSPDGNLGGKGYIQKIMDMRKQYMNVVEALSALSDTIYDEINAPHWAAISRQETEEEKEEVAQIIQDAEEIKEDPEGWAEEQEEEMDGEHKPMARTASSKIPKKYLRGDK